MSVHPMAMAAVVKERGRWRCALRCLLFQHEPVTKVHAIYSTVMGKSTGTGSIHKSNGWWLTTEANLTGMHMSSIRASTNSWK
jgi:hypothetical protein